MSIDSSLLYTKEDGIQDFVHDSYKDFFLAKYFTDRINDGRLSIRDAWVNYWSYEEDAELWDLPKDREGGALLPGWENVLLYLADMLDNNKCNELVHVITRNYFKYEEKIRTKEIGDYNPFYDDLVFTAKFIGNCKNKQSIKYRAIVDSLTRRFENRISFGINPFGHYDLSELSALADMEEGIDFLLQLDEKYGNQLLPTILHSNHFLLNTKSCDKVYKFLECDEITLALIKAIPKIQSQDCGKHYLDDRTPFALQSLKPQNKKARDFLFKYALEKKSSKYRYWAFLRLAELDTEESIDFLIKFAGTQKKDRGNAILCLQHSKRQNALDFLIDYARDKRHKYREEAFEAICYNGSERALNFLIDYASDNNNNDRWRLFSVFGKLVGLEELSLATEKFRNIFCSFEDIFIKYMREESNTYRSFAVDLLGQIKSQEAVPYIIEYLREESDQTDRSSAIEALGKIGDKEAIPVLVEFTEYEDRELKKKVLEALKKITNENAVLAVIEYGSYDKEEVSHLLAKISDEDSIDLLKQYAKDRKNPGWVTVAKKLVAQRKGDEFIDYLLEELERKYWLRDGSIILALGDSGSEKAITPLIEYIKDRNHFSTESALDKLVRIGNPRVIPDLIEYLRDRNNPNIREQLRVGSNLNSESVALAISKLGNKDTITLLRESPYELNIFDPEYIAIHSIYQRLKPQGYNPPVKKLLT